LQGLLPATARRFAVVKRTALADAVGVVFAPVSRVVMSRTVLSFVMGSHSCSRTLDSMWSDQPKTLKTSCAQALADRRDLRSGIGEFTGGSP